MQRDTDTSCAPLYPLACDRIFPEAPLFAAGYSLGGLILTKFLAEADMGMHGDYSSPSAAAGGSGEDGDGGDIDIQSMVEGSGEGPERYEGSGLTAAAVVSSPVCMYNSSANLLRPWTISYL